MSAGSKITAPWQAEWRGHLFGWPATRWTISNIDGWLSLPDSTATLTARQGRWGSYAGQQTFGSRTVEITFELTDYATTADLRRLRAALSPPEDPQEEPLVLWCGTEAPELIYARVDKAAIPTDYAFSMGYTTVTVSWVSTSAYRYSLAEQVAWGKVLAEETRDGLRFPLRFPLTFGSGSGGGIVTAYNTGSSTAWPVLEVIGPCAGPVITELESGRKLAFSPALVLSADDTLSIDTDARYASQSGITRDGLLRTREWFGLAPGTATRLRFSAEQADPAARLIVRWRNASAL